MEDKETGQQIEDNDYFRIQARQLGNSVTQCQHCFCGSITINNKEHIVCCMCGHRQLKNPITY